MPRQAKANPNSPNPAGQLALVGHHNVGKSVIFHLLTGHYVTVSNYPGTTVEVSRGKARDLKDMMVIDTPGVVTLPAHSEDEHATARVLLQEPLRNILQVGDAKNLRRTLLLTIQLAEMGIPMALALNMMDEANSRGVSVDHKLLAARLGIPVVPTIAITGDGIPELKQAIQAAPSPRFHLSYPADIENAIHEILPDLPQVSIAPRALALLWLCGDSETADLIRKHTDKEEFEHLVAHRDAVQLGLAEPLSAIIQRARLDHVEKLASAAILEEGSGWRGFAPWLSRVSAHPLWGLPLLALALLSLYWFVGIFGAGTLVDLLENGLFGQVVNPWVTSVVETLIPVPLLSDFLVGEYGLWTMGMTYALALILPIVTTFFLAFSVMEDSGYLPRLAVLTNRLFQFIGLNGKAVLPMVLGLGCVTMATATTRVLPGKRERLLVILLLALAIPCSAQLGVVMGMLAGVSFSATLIWASVVMLVMLAVGWLSARLLPGERSSLLLELPPLRRPILSNVLAKTFSRLEWYLKEVIPLFLLGTAILFVLDKTHVLSWLIQVERPLVTQWLGLPPEAGTAFLQGFLRRDFGATGFFVMNSQGLLSPLQVVVAMVTITLFVPCLASVLMIAKERGWRTSLGIVLLIFPLAFLIGGLLSRILAAIGWGT
ncbi:MAG: ferrous iron transport protein B [Anaerolineales bacterium]